MVEFDGLSMRQALIKVSEEVIKPNFGKDYFGKATAMSIINCDAYNLDEDIFYITDSGFIEELDRFVDIVEEQTNGCNHVYLLVNLYRDGTSFEKYNDSRSYINTNRIPQYTLHNDSDIEIVNGMLDEFINHSTDTMMEGEYNL